MNGWDGHKDVAFPWRRWLLALLCVGLTAPALADPVAYLYVDHKWYPVNPGSSALTINLGSKLVDAPGAVITAYCRRTNGDLPSFAPWGLLMGTQLVDLVNANNTASIKLHFAVNPPVIEFNTPTGDVSCGPGVDPPDEVEDAVTNPPGLNDLFSNGFEP